MDQLDSAIKEFLLESRENLDEFDRDLLAIEQAPADRDRHDRIFRAVHTIKGTCGFFDMPRLEAVAHAGEALLAAHRDGRVAWSPAITDVLLRLGDAIRGFLAVIEETGNEGGGDFSELIADLESLQQLRVAGAAAGGRDEVVPPGPDDPHASALADGTIRVDVGLLDRIMNLVGELVLARNQIFRFAASRHDPSFQTISQRLNLITSELQEGVMKARMQPIGSAWSRFPRLVRDVSLACGKLARIEMDGTDTELDKSVIEAIKGPLTHVVRNAIDHGIEPPAARRALGKPAEGRITLRASHGGGMVNIEVADDGAGFDASRIRRKAVERGLIPPDAASQADDVELLDLIFLPGFSTAEAVTSVSGRGVGMDVVRANVERVGGTVDVRSRPGEGATLKFRIPLTLAIIPALIVGSGGDRYAIPQVSLLELVRIEPGSEAGRGIEWIQGIPIFRLRGELLPVVHLDRSLQDGASTSGEGAGPSNLVVLQADDRRLGLVVPEVYDTEEIVVKPLARQLERLTLFSGATILGDGKVALILDVAGIARQAGMAAARGPAAVPRVGVTTEATVAEKPYLLVGLGRDRRLALPLGLVERLEEIDPSAVERTIDREVVQHRGGILPLVRLGDLFGGGEPADERLQVVIVRGRGRIVGLVVDRILDTASCSGEVMEPSSGFGRAGTTLIQGRVTEVLDIAAILDGPVPCGRRAVPVGEA